MVDIGKTVVEVKAGLRYPTLCECYKAEMQHQDESKNMYMGRGEIAQTADDSRKCECVDGGKRYAV